MENLALANNFLAKYEALWLFVLIGLELVCGVVTVAILILEYNYDRMWNERKAARRKRHLNFTDLNIGEGK